MISRGAGFFTQNGRHPSLRTRRERSKKKRDFPGRRGLWGRFALGFADESQRFLTFGFDPKGVPQEREPGIAEREEAFDFEVFEEEAPEGALAEERCGGESEIPVRVREERHFLGFEAEGEEGIGGEAIGAWIFTEMSAQGVGEEVEGGGHGLEVILDERGEGAVLGDLTAAMVLAVEVGAVASVVGAHERGERSWVLNEEDFVDVVGHEDGGDEAIGLFGEFELEEVEVLKAILAEMDVPFFIMAAPGFHDEETLGDGMRARSARHVGV